MKTVQDTYKSRQVGSHNGPSNGVIFNVLARPYPRFQSQAIIWLWISQKWLEMQICGMLWTYKSPTQRRHFEWPWVTLSDLAKYSMT